MGKPIEDVEETANKQKMITAGRASKFIQQQDDVS